MPRRTLAVPQLPKQTIEAWSTRVRSEEVVVLTKCSIVQKVVLPNFNVGGDPCRIHGISNVKAAAFHLHVCYEARFIKCICAKGSRSQPLLRVMQYLGFTNVWFIQFVTSAASANILHERALFSSNIANVAALWFKGWSHSVENRGLLTISLHEPSRTS